MDAGLVDAAANVHVVLDRFEAAWQEGTPPPLDDFLPPADATAPTRRQVLCELIKIDLEYRWRWADRGVLPSPSGKPSLPDHPRLEHYCEILPELGSPQRLPIELIGEEYRVRQRFGDRPKHAEYARRFPKAGRRLGPLLTAIDAELDSEQPTHNLRSPAALAEPANATPLACPHCRQPVEILTTMLLGELACAACGGSFSLASVGGSSAPPVQPPFPRLSRFEIKRLLGTGAFGSVWEAWDPELARSVAVKVPRQGSCPTSEDEERFLREARAAARLHHPGIIAIHDVGRDQGTVYIVSELVPGVSLAEWLTHQRMSFRAAAQLVAAVADALDFAHERGIVHRDVKPSNIMLSSLVNGPSSVASDKSTNSANFGPRTTDYGPPKLMDFGLALRNANEVTMTLDGQVLGTPAYISPEQLQNAHAVDGRADVYSLGVILYELLTDVLPFRGLTRMLLDQVLHDAPRPPRRLNERIPVDLETICLKCLAKEPAGRYPTAGALAADLRRWLAGEAIQARPLGLVQRLGQRLRRQVVHILTGILAGVALVASIGLPAAVVVLTCVSLTIAALAFAIVKAKRANDLAAEIDDLRQEQLRLAAKLQAAMRQAAPTRTPRN